MRIGFLFDCFPLKDTFTRDGQYRLYLKASVQAFGETESFLHASIIGIITQTGYRILHLIMNGSVATSVHGVGCLGRMVQTFDLDLLQDS